MMIDNVLENRISNLQREISANCREIVRLHAVVEKETSELLELEAERDRICGLKVRIMKTTRGHPSISPPGTILREGDEVQAKSNPHGAISGLCQNGQWLGLFPEEFEFITAPEWVLRIWARHCPDKITVALKGASHE